MKNIFYVYVYLDPRKKGPFMYGKYTFDYEPFYVGKGKKEQYISHLNQALNENIDILKVDNMFKFRKIRKILNQKLKPIIVKYKQYLSEELSLDLEIKLISLIGRNDLGKGPLTNLTDGGEGFTGLWTSRARKKSSESHKGIKPSKETILKRSKSLTGLRRTNEQKRKMSESHKGNFIGKDNPFFGKTHSKEVKDKISKKNKGKIRTDEVKRKLSEAAKLNSYSAKIYKIIFTNKSEKIIYNLSKFCRDNKYSIDVFWNIVSGYKPGPKSKYNNIKVIKL